MGWFFVQEQGLPHDLRRRLRSFFLSPGWSIYDFLGKNYGKILWKTTLRKLQDEYTVHGCDRSNHPPVVRLPLWIDGLKARVLLELNQALSQFFFLAWSPLRVLAESSSTWGRTGINRSMPLGPWFPADVEVWDQNWIIDRSIPEGSLFSLPQILLFSWYAFFLKIGYPSSNCHCWSSVPEFPYILIRINYGFEVSHAYFVFCCAFFEWLWLVCSWQHVFHGTVACLKIKPYLHDSGGWSCN